MAYKIDILRAARKQMLSLPRAAQVLIAEAIDRLADTPRPASSKRLRGADLWRLRVRHYRVIYTIDDKAKLVSVTKVAPRREDTYRRL